MANKLELTWVGKEKKIDIEPRILIEDKNKSYGDEQNENMLIHGDNLLALKSLESKFVNRIKCIYIDPPYNADAYGVPFDDNIEHSFYLNLMKLRIEILYKLLAQNGIFCMQCDYNEMAYLKVLCDEVFGRNNYVTMITVKTSSESGVKVNANKPAKVSEYILMYAKDKEKLVYKTIRVKTGYDKNYNKYIENPEDDSCKWKFRNIKDVLAEQTGKNKQDLSDDDLREFQIKNKDRIFSVRDISESLKKFIKENNIDKEKIYEYVTSTGKKTLLLKNGEVVFVKNKVFNIEGKEELTKIASDIWIDISWDGIANEGGVKLKNSKKPERLIQRIFEAYTNENDWVLDSFLGSGTTSAVALKMNRKWIGIEIGDHCYNQCIPRLNNVIDGKDNTGISNIVNWKGGGGYKFYELAPSLINIDSFGEPVINKEYNAEMLASAVALHEGFTYNPSNEFFWKQSKGNENSYLYVTTKFVNKNDINKIKEEMNDAEYLVIACTAYDKEIDGLYKNIKIKKIPAMLLSKCEFGKDNYNLNIINPPEYEEECEDDE